MPALDLLEARRLRDLIRAEEAHLARGRHRQTVKSTRRWRIGPVLLIAGGVLECCAYVLAVTSPAMNVFLGEMVLRVDVIALGTIGVGLIVTGFSVVGRGRTALKVAGVLALTVGSIEAVHAEIPLGPLPGFFAYLAYVVAVVVAGLLLLSNRNLRGRARWSVAVAGMVLLFSISGDYVPLFAPVLSLAGMTLLPWVGMIVGGVLLLGGAQRSGSAAIDPIRG